MDIKIECQCGQRIAFEVEPMADGRLPVEIECPACGADVTALGDAVLAQGLARESHPPLPASPPPPPTGSRPPPPVPAVIPAAQGLRLSRPAGNEHGAPPTSPGTGTGTPTTPERSIPQPAPRPVTKLTGDPNLGRSILGACIGAALMTALWFGLWKGTGATWGILAVAVGWMAGFFARMIGRSEGQKMALAVAGVALLFIFGFQFYRAHAELSFLHTDDAEIEKEFTQQLAHARKLVEAIPGGTDEEIRAYLIKESRKDSDPVNTEEITAEDLKFFRQITLKSAKNFVEGRTTKENYRAEIRKNEDEVSQNIVVRILFWVRAIGIFSIVFIVIGVGAAYKFGNGEG